MKKFIALLALVFCLRGGWLRYFPVHTSLCSHLLKLMLIMQ